MNANELKQYIIDNNCIDKILTDLGCHSIKEYATEWRSALPNGKNATAICIKKDTLSTSIRTSDGSKYGDIFTLTMDIKKCSFGKANKYLHSVLGLRYSYSIKKEQNKKDPLEIFKKIKRQRYVVNNDYKTYDDSILREYTDLPHIDWVREGILPSVCKKFNIGYSYDRKRIIIPWKKWDGDNNEKYMGIVGRTTVDNYEMFDIPKYFGIVPFSKGKTLYGLNENYKDIIEHGNVNVFESEKSVLKRCSRLDNTGVAVGCHAISEEQARILIGLNVDITIMFDKDVSKHELYDACDKFYHIRNVYFVVDKWNLLGEKESPADKPDKIFKFMEKYKNRYDEKCHKELLKMRKE